MLILDFDGTLTDAEVEGAPFREGYLDDLAILTGLDRAEVGARADAIAAEVAADAGRYGWTYLGHIVAPATVDPYLRVMPIARRLLDDAGVFPGDLERARLLDGILYKYNYAKSAIAFRPGARDFLSERRGTETWIVTNSATAPVQDKVRALAGQGDPDDLTWLVERVHGFGKKYVVDPAWDAVPEAMTLPGLERPVLLRRRRYFDTLDRLRAGQPWSSVTVLGDIFELDLCLPLALGARVGLLANPFTPTYEIDYLRAQPRGAVLRSLDEAREFVQGVA